MKDWGYSINKDSQIDFDANDRSITNYILSKELKEDESKEILRKFKLLVTVLSCDEKVIDLGLNSDFKDFEDSVQYFTAIENDQDIIITRNQPDFKESKIPIMTAGEFIKSIRK